MADSVPAAMPTDMNTGSIIIGNPPTPDFTVSNITKTIVHTGADASTDPTTYTVSFDVNNIGNDDAPASIATIDVDGVTVNVAIDAIAHGASFSATSSEITLTGAKDNFTITADGNSVIAESNESNNSTSDSFTFLYPVAGVLHETAIDGYISGSLEFTVPASVDFGAMSLGNNNYSGILNVKTNDDWQVNIKSDADTNGFMTKWDGSVYATNIQLHNAMVITTTGGNVPGETGYVASPGQVTPENNIVTLTDTEQILAKGNTDGQVTSIDGLSTQGEDRGLSYDQLVVASDAAATYHIVVSFIATNIVN